MQISNNMLQARQRILENGIQQTNRYRFKFSRMDKFLYPYEIILPGLGFESIDHSIWSVVRKIPFRKSFTDLQVKFIMGKSNYAEWIDFWNYSYIVTPNSLTGDRLANAERNNIVALLNSGVSIYNSDEGSGANNPAIPTTGVVGDLTNMTLALRQQNPVGQAIGGSPEYSNYIQGDYVSISLLDESGNLGVNSSLYFYEAYVTQIQPTQLTSVETGYSTFTVNFKFAKIATI